MKAIRLTTDPASDLDSETLHPGANETTILTYSAAGHRGSAQEWVSTTNHRAATGFRTIAPRTTTLGPREDALTDGSNFLGSVLQED